MDKKAYETPTVTKVEFDASDRITASSCVYYEAYLEEGDGNKCVEL